MRQFKTFNFNKNRLQITTWILFLYMIIVHVLTEEAPGVSFLQRYFPYLFGSRDDFSILLLIITLLFLCLFIYSLLRIFNYTIITYRGIENRMVFPRITLIKKSWREIKHYANVTEIFSSEIVSSSSPLTVEKLFHLMNILSPRDEIIKAIWFIDFNDKVCFRLTEWGSYNFKELMEKADKFEDKFEIKLEYKNPYLTLNGWKKVEYPKKLENKK